MSSKSPDAKERHDRITILKVGKHWVFKHFFDDEEHFKGLIDLHKSDECLFEFKTTDERDKTLVFLGLSGFDIDLVEDLSGYIVKMDKSRKYAPVLKNSVACTETPRERIFVMKDLASVEDALDFGAEVYESDLGSNSKLITDLE